MFHFTCRHRAAIVAQHGLVLRPAVDLLSGATVGRYPIMEWLGRYVWLTDLPDPEYAALGFRPPADAADHCDRLACRFTIAGAPLGIRPWARVRSTWPPKLVAILEGDELDDEQRPQVERWFVSRLPLRVRPIPHGRAHHGQDERARNPHA